MNLNQMPDITTLPALSVDIDMFDKLLNQSLTLTFQNSSLAFHELQEKTNNYIKNVFPNFDLSKLPIVVDPQLQNNFCYKNKITRPIESLPKSLDEFKNVFPNFVPPDKTPVIPSVSSLESKRTLHEETKKELTPIEQMLDENFKQMHATIQQALSAARSVRLEIDEKLLNGPIHPYQKMVYQYLGPNFKTPSVYDLELPQNFCPVTTLQSLNDITNSFFENTMTQFEHLTAGIGKIENEDEQALMEGLGHGFSVLSATSEGMMFIIDKEKAAQYIEFAEIFRSIPVRDIVDNPVDIAKRVLNRVVQIFKPEAGTKPFLVHHKKEVEKIIGEQTPNSNEALTRFPLEAASR